MDVDDTPDSKSQAPVAAQGDEEERGKKRKAEEDIEPEASEAKKPKTEVSLSLP